MKIKRLSLSGLPPIKILEPAEEDEDKKAEAEENGKENLFDLISSESYNVEIDDDLEEYVKEILDDGDGNTDDDDDAESKPVKELREPERPVIQREKENIEEVAEATSRTSEDVHGGDEATGDIKDSPNPKDNGENRRNRRDSEGGGDDGGKNGNSGKEGNKNGKKNGSNGKGGESKGNNGNNGGTEGSGRGNGEGNMMPDRTVRPFGNAEYSANSIDKEMLREMIDEVFGRYRNRKLEKAIADAIAVIAEEVVEEGDDGDDLWDMDELMMRRFTKKSPMRCRYEPRREDLVIVIDTSASCYEWIPLFMRVAAVVLGTFDNVTVITAPNGGVMGFIDSHGKIVNLYSWNGKPLEGFDHPEYDGEKIKRLPDYRGVTIVFLGDFDGSYNVCLASEHNRVFWLSNETRYLEIDSHDWSMGKTFEDFHGHFLPFDELEDLVKALRMIPKIAEKKPNPEENRRRHYKFMEDKGYDIHAEDYDGDDYYDDDDDDDDYYYEDEDD